MEIELPVLKIASGFSFIFVKLKSDSEIISKNADFIIFCTTANSFNKLTKQFTYFLLLFLISGRLKSQSADTTKLGSFYLAAGIEASAYATSIAGLNYLWYADYPRSNFHFFNDADEWLQMDKVGHAYSSYWLCKASSRILMPYASRKQAVITGTSLAYAYMLSIEAFDGFSPAWGASVSDLLANSFGAALYVSQLNLDSEVAMMKFSFRHTAWPKYRSELLGDSKLEQVLKDYNGQTYWLCVNASSILPESRMPKWLTIAIGYGADGMVGGKTNNHANSNATYDDSYRKRQFYFSLDADLTKIPAKRKAFMILFEGLNCIKVPFPFICFDKDGLRLGI